MENLSLTSSQNEVFKKLTDFYAISRCNISSVASIQVRPWPLIIGPSGSGKTFLVKSLARTSGVPMLSLNLHNWVVRGARMESQITLEQVAGFVAKNPSGIIFIDEVNKLNNLHAEESSWSASILSEVLALLDLDEKLSSMGFQGAVKKMKKSFFLVGAASFQSEWNSQASRIGFDVLTSCPPSAEYELAVRSQKIVPDELLFRFNDNLLVISPPTAAEFGSRIVSVRTQLSLPPVSDPELDKICIAAVASKKMFRWLETYTTECILTAPSPALKLLAFSSLKDEPSLPPPSPEPVLASASQEYLSSIEEAASACVSASFALKGAAFTAEMHRRSSLWKNAYSSLRKTFHYPRKSTDSTFPEILLETALELRRITSPGFKEDPVYCPIVINTIDRLSELSVVVFSLVGPLNIHNAGDYLIDTLSAFVDAVQKLKTCHLGLTTDNSPHPSN